MEEEIKDGMGEEMEVEESIKEGMETEGMGEGGGVHPVFTRCY